MEAILINYTIPEKVQLNIKKILKKYPNGLWGSKLLEEYRKSFHEELVYEQFGYGSVLHMCSDITYLLEVVKHFKGDFKLFPANSNAPKIFTQPDKLPDGVVQYNEIIPRQQLPATNNPIPMKVSHIYNPSRFWFYTTEMESKLIDVMNRMQLFYTSTGKYYHIPTYLMRTKMYCATIYSGKFHRGIIADVLPELVHSVKVFFIDYGTLDLVNVKNIFFLHESFREPNALGLRGQLALVKPTGLNLPWPEEAITLFESLVSQKGLQAYIETTKREESGVEYVLKLYDKFPGRCFWVHDKLIDAGLGINVEWKQDPTQSIPEYIKTQMHLVPSFRDLESGLAPTRDDLHVLKNMDYPMHKILNKFVPH